MKKFYSVLLILAVAPAFAQLTQSNNAPASGDTYSMWESTLTVGPGAAGSGVTWDFHTMTTQSLVVAYTATTASNATYANANVLQSWTGNNTAYYGSSTGA